MKILIVGAGPTGLTAAIELSRRGFSPRIIDKKEAPSPLSRAVGISAHSLDVLEPSGVTEKLLARGFKIPHVKGFYGRDYFGAIHMDVIDHRYNFMLALPQNETEHVMIEVLDSLGHAPEFGQKLTSLKIENDKAVVTLNDGAPETYDLVIGADGIRSPVREGAGIPFPGHDYPTRWSIADFVSHDWPHDAAMMFLKGGGFRFVIKIGEDRYRAVADQPEALAGIPIPYTLDKINRADDFVISVRQAETYQKGPVVLAGDAAHVHSPAGGRGMNLGIEDACELARRIAEDDLAGYTTARHMIGKRWIELSEQMVRTATATRFWPRWLFRTMIRLTSLYPPLQKPLVSRVAGLIE